MGSPSGAFPTQSPAKVFALGAVIALHLLVAVLLASSREAKQVSLSQSIQVVSIDAPAKTESHAARVEPTLTPAVVPDVVMIAPEIEIAVEAATHSISVPTAVAAANAEQGFTPKTVSIVDYVREPQPKYPSAARALKQRGTVLLRALIDTQGHAAEVQIYKSSGYRLLDEAGREAVARALFKPYTENGSAQPVYVLVPIEFGSA